MTTIRWRWIAVAVLCCPVALAASASAECAWVLWASTGAAGQESWSLVGAFGSENICRIRAGEYREKASPAWSFVWFPTPWTRGPEAERRIRQEACEALQEAGVTAPVVETDAAPGGVIDESEAVLGGVSITVRIPPAAIRDLVEVKIVEALMAAGFDPAIGPDEG